MTVAWVRLDDGFFGNPKIVALGDRDLLVYLAAICYAAAHLTDGHISDAAWPTIGVQAKAGSRSVKRAVSALESSGLVHRNGSGWQIHDFLHYNPSREKVLADRENARRRQAKHREVSRRD